MQLRLLKSWAILFLCLCVAMDRTAALFADMPKRVKANVVSPQLQVPHSSSVAPTRFAMSMFVKK